MFEESFQKKRLVPAGKKETSQKIHKGLFI